MSDKLLSVDGLSKYFVIDSESSLETRLIEAVKNISFELLEGESVGLIGESGCGKSTTASMLLKLLQPSEGTIELFGDDITFINESVMRPYRKDIQAIFQSGDEVLDPKMTLRELIEEPIRIHKVVPKDKVENEVLRVMSLIGLDASELEKYPTQLSGGQKQRVVIGRAIAVRPRIIICDEPVSALDVSVQGQILNLLIDMKKKFKLTYLFISHDLNVVKHLCDRILVMHRGHIIERGATQDVLASPQHEQTQMIVGSMNMV